MRMKKKMKRIGVLTSGGDAPGMNAAIRSIVRSAVHYKMEAFGIFRGYEGLINEEMKILDHRSVSNIINRGGTILKTGRSDKFKTAAGRRRAYEVIKRNNIDGLVLIGGDGTYRGGHIFNKEWGVPCIGVPGSIDNDIKGTDFTIGSDTAVNTALEAIDKIRDTATSMERIFIVEVMGRSSGYIAINAALSGGAEDVLIPERKYDMQELCQDIVEGNLRGKMSWIVIVAEGVAKAGDIAKMITDTTSLETRVVTLGHIQRGGSPTARDRTLATRLGAEAVSLLRKGLNAKAVGVIGNKINIVGLGTAVTKKAADVNSLCRLIKILT
ncbi:MAG: 6-phosphofructokinase [Candidatus Omnitrophota bacterium]|nr:6-phosphofructokinase [Candidatus Omnitrophota bacterium]